MQRGEKSKDARSGGTPEAKDAAAKKSQGESAAGRAEGKPGLAGWGVMLPSFDPFLQGTPPLLEGARLAEDLGFDSGWVGDHLSFHPPILEATCALSAVAAVTQRLRLGFGVLLLAMRNQAYAASQIGTVHALAPGRVILGAGVGGENPAEFEAAGVPVRERGRRLDEALSILPDFLSGNPVDHPGPLAPIRSPRIAPVPGYMLPLVVGGRSARALVRSARYADGWLAVWLGPQRLAEQQAFLAEQAALLGRPTPVTIMLVFVNVNADRSRGRAEAAALVDGQYKMPFEKIERWTALGGPSEVAAELATYCAQGVREFVLVPAAPDPLTQFERFAEVRVLLEQAVGRLGDSVLPQSAVTGRAVGETLE